MMGTLFIIVLVVFSLVFMFTLCSSNKDSETKRNNDCETLAKYIVENEKNKCITKGGRF